MCGIHDYMRFSRGLGNGELFFRILMVERWRLMIGGKHFEFELQGTRICIISTLNGFVQLYKGDVVSYSAEQSIMTNQEFKSIYDDDAIVPLTLTTI